MFFISPITRLRNFLFSFENCLNYQVICSSSNGISDRSKLHFIWSSPPFKNIFLKSFIQVFIVSAGIVTQKETSKARFHCNLNSSFTSTHPCKYSHLRWLCCKHSYSYSPSMKVGRTFEYKHF